MIPLLETPHGSIRSLLPDGRDAASWHPALASEITSHLTPAHAAILAVPVPGRDGMVWQAEATQARRYADLTSADREALMRAVQVILSDIRRLAESGASSAVARCWPALREIPDLGMLFAADGRPALAGWGATPQSAPAARGLLLDADDGRPWRPTPRPPWAAYGTAAAALGALALAAGLLLPRLNLPRATDAACMAAPGELDALNAQAQQDARHGTLQAELARLVEEQGRRRLQCPLPTAAPPSPTPPPPLPRRAEAPTPPPGPPPALPQDRWNRHDLSMLEGCWSRVSNMVILETPSNRQLPVASWRLCFDQQGRGTQTLTLRNGGHCVGPLEARFQGSRISIEAGRCFGPGLRFVRSQEDCTRVSDEEAHCVGHNLEGIAMGNSDESIFRR